MSDNLGNMLNKIKNALLIRQEVILIPYTLNNFLILKILCEEGLLESVNIISKKKGSSFSVCTEKNDSFLPINRENLRCIKVQLKYSNIDRKPSIKNIVRLSKPSLQVYTNHKNIPQILNGLGVIIMSTSKGIMTNKDAFKNGVGGELLFSIW